MKSKQNSRIKCLDTTAVLKKTNLIITKDDLTGLSKLSWQRKKVKLGKMIGDGRRTGLTYLQKF